jgi:hypothetical protein
MTPVTFLVLTALLLLAMMGGVAGILLEHQRDTSRAAWHNPAIRDALLPIAGWGSLFALDFSVTLVGGHRLPVGFKHLLGTLAVLFLYYAVLSTLCLIYRSARRIHARLRSDDKPMRSRAIPYLGQLAFPTLFTSAVLATVSVLLYDGLSQNLAFIACILGLIGILRRTRRSSASAEQSIN